MTSQTTKAKTACDQCRFRKLRCNGDLPCDRCFRMEFECSFTTRTTRNKRVEMLRGQRHQSLPSPNHTSDSFPTELGFSPPAEAEVQPIVEFPQRTEHQFLSIDNDQPPVPRNVDLQAQPFTLVHSPYSNAQTISQPRTLSSAITVVPLTELPSDEHSDSPGFMAASPFSTMTAQNRADAAFSESDVMPWINIFFDRLYPTLPIVNRFALYRDIVGRRQSQDPDFAAMVLSLSALALIQPVLREEHESMPSRVTLATKMLQASMKLRSHTFGENLTVLSVVSSFFMFATLFGLGNQNAAWLRLREAVECGKIIGLHRPETYRHLSKDEKGQRFRLFLILSVTERGYALQRNHYISFTGQHLSKMDGIYREIETAATSEISSILVHDDKDVTAMHGLLQLMKLFDSVDEDVIQCWNRSCSIAQGSCTQLTATKVQRVFNAVSEAMPSSRARHATHPVQNHLNVGSSAEQFSGPTLNDPQWADCFVLQQWLLVRLWVSCLTHDLLDENSSLHFMKSEFAVSVAANVWEQCRQLETRVLEVHGIGMIERLFDVAMGVCMAIEHCKGSDHAHAITSGHATLQHYFVLLDHLRNGGHTYSSTLREAYESIQT